LTFTKQSPNLSIGNRQCLLLLVLACFGAATASEARQTPPEIARGIVIGQVYASGNIYLAGFDEDEKRTWPSHVTLVPLQKAPPRNLQAEFVRVVGQDSEEHRQFPRREGGGDEGKDIFATMDKAEVQDRNLARYRAAMKVTSPESVFGWDAKLSFGEISYSEAGQPRPVSERERREIDVEKRKGPPAGIKCTTEPRYLDSATQLLTAKLSRSLANIRLSRYTTPGCAGHLADIYILDVLVPNQPPRRFEFTHAKGVM
jgi:hypothetical protein